jgi:hypothetical protein
MGFARDGQVVRSGDGLAIRGETVAGVAMQGEVVYRDQQDINFLKQWTFEITRSNIDSWVGFVFQVMRQVEVTHVGAWTSSASVSTGAMRLTNAVVGTPFVNQSVVVSEITPPLGDPIMIPGAGATGGIVYAACPPAALVPGNLYALLVWRSVGGLAFNDSAANTGVVLNDWSNTVTSIMSARAAVGGGNLVTSAADRVYGPVDFKFQ